MLRYLCFYWNIFRISHLTDTTLQAEATNGQNSGYRFSGSGSLAYSRAQTTSPCSYGGLTYAYTNTSIRTWKPGPANIGNIICIPHIFGGMYAQGSNEARAKANIWVPQGKVLFYCLLFEASLILTYIRQHCYTCKRNFSFYYSYCRQIFFTAFSSVFIHKCQ